MTMYEIIQKKKRGGALTGEEIKFFIDGIVTGDIPDYQAAALLMAVFFRGMDKEETYRLTAAMAATGEPYEYFSDCPIADKHSTGGVSDAVTLVIAPLIALSGIKFLKMSGRALGHTGGTIDKLESIPGFSAALTPAEVKRILDTVGAVIIGQSEKSAPADKKLYALRDVTATVDSIPLITASIMSKKLLSPATVLVLDVKYGSGAFLKTRAEAEELAAYMRYAGERAGRKTECVISPNEEPPGRFIGNATEVYGAVEVLEGARNTLARQSAEIAAEIIRRGLSVSAEEAGDFIKKQIESGAAKLKLAEIIAAQGGDSSYITDKRKLLAAKHTLDVTASRAGKIAATDAEGLGLAAVALGGGRLKKEDTVDYFAGIEIFKKIGDCIKEGDKLAKIYYNRDNNIEQTAKAIADCFKLSGDFDCGQ